MGECDGKHKTSIGGLPESPVKQVVDRLVVVFLRPLPEPIRFDAEADQMDVRIFKVLHLLTEFRCVPSATAVAVKDWTVELAIDVYEGAAVFIGDFRLKRRLLVELFKQFLSLFGDLPPAVAFNSRVVVGIDGDEIVRHRPWIRQIVPHGHGLLPALARKTGLFPSVGFFSGSFPGSVRKHFLFASVLIGDREVEDDSAWAAAVDHGGAESIRATGQGFRDVVLLGGAVSGDAFLLMIDAFAVQHDNTRVINEIGDGGLFDFLAGHLEFRP